MSALALHFFTAPPLPDRLKVPPPSYHSVGSGKGEIFARTWSGRSLKPTIRHHLQTVISTRKPISIHRYRLFVAWYVIPIATDFPKLLLLFNYLTHFRSPDSLLPVGRVWPDSCAVRHDGFLFFPCRASGTAEPIWTKLRTGEPY